MTGAPRTDTIWFNCSVGVAGDMLLGTLVDAGADADHVAAAIAGVGASGYALNFERVRRGRFTATWANVVVDEKLQHRHRTAGEIIELLDAAGLSERTGNRAAAVFAELAGAEGQVHGIDPADVELHEVGALDAIVDVVGVCAALESLGVGHVTSSAVGLGHGTVQTAHGLITHPAPAVSRMLADHAVPVTGIDTPLELATPTGVALLVTLCDSFGATPPMRVSRTGFGAGTADPPDRANAVGALLGVGLGDPDREPRRTAVQIDTNVDDVSGEILAHTISALVAAGAHDAWATPIVMKKGRPAHTLSVLASAEDEARLRQLLVDQTGTLGTRTTMVHRAPERRRLDTVSLDGVELRVKRAGGRVKVEYEDAATASEQLGLPLRDVLRAAEQLGHPSAPF